MSINVTAKNLSLSFLYKNFPKMLINVFLLSWILTTVGDFPSVQCCIQVFNVILILCLKVAKVHLTNIHSSLQWALRQDTAAWDSFTQQILGSNLCTCPSLEQRTRETRSGLQVASWERGFGEIFYHRCTTIVLRFFYCSLLPSFRLLWVSSTSSS